MLIRVSDPSDPAAREVTPETLYLRRREFLRGAVTTAGVVAGALLVAGCRSNGEATSVAAEAPTGLAAIPNLVKGPFATDETPTSYGDATSYNNFYEFGTERPIRRKTG